MKLFPHQIKSLDLTKNYNRCAYYLDMGLGKTFVGAEKMIQLGSKINLVVCQKSKVDDWRNHFAENYKYDISAYDKLFESFVCLDMNFQTYEECCKICIIKIKVFLLNTHGYIIIFYLYSTYLTG